MKKKLLENFWKTMLMLMKKNLIITYLCHCKWNHGRRLQNKAKNLWKAYRNSKVCISAIFWVLKSIEKCAFQVERILDLLKVEDNRTHRREFLIHWSSLSKCFQFIMIAADQDPSDMLFQNINSKDVQLLWKHIEIVEIEDQFEHFWKLHQAIDYIKYIFHSTKGVGLL